MATPEDRTADDIREREEAPPPVRVLISYAHGDPGHEEDVRRLWTLLRAEGVDARLDLAAASQRQFWPQWM